MKRRTFLTAAGAVLGAPYIIGSSAFAAENLELLTPGVLKSATEGTYPPFSFRGTDGKLDGLEMRMMGEICNRLGLAYEPVVIKWESMLIGLLSDQYDIVGNAMSITEERQEEVTFCDGWLESGAQLVVPTDSPITGYDNLAGRKIGTLTASVYVPMIEGWGAEVAHYKADLDGMMDAINGQVDGVVMDSIAAAYVIKKSKLDMRLVGSAQSAYQMGWAVKKGKPNLVKAVNSARAEMVADGTVKELFADLIGIDPSPKEPIRSIL